MILVECDSDVTLVTELGVPRRQVEHSYDKGRICNYLEKSNGAKGLVDEDPGSNQPGYISRLKLRAEENDIRVLVDDVRDNMLIVLCPRLEEWLLKTAQDAQIKAEDFGLSSRANELHGMLGVRAKSMRKLLQALKNSKRLNKLAEYVV